LAVETHFDRQLDLTRRETGALGPAGLDEAQLAEHAAGRGLATKKPAVIDVNPATLKP
jgi:hypothetical protein